MISRKAGDVVMRPEEVEKLIRALEAPSVIVRVARGDVPTLSWRGLKRCMGLFQPDDVPVEVAYRPGDEPWEDVLVRLANLAEMFGFEKVSRSTDWETLITMPQRTPGEPTQYGEVYFPGEHGGMLKVENDQVRICIRGLNRELQNEGLFQEAVVVCMEGLESKKALAAMVNAVRGFGGHVPRWLFYRARGVGPLDILESKAVVRTPTLWRTEVAFES